MKGSGDREHLIPSTQGRERESGEGSIKKPSSDMLPTPLPWLLHAWVSHFFKEQVTCCPWDAQSQARWDLALLPIPLSEKLPLVPQGPFLSHGHSVLGFVFFHSRFSFFKSSSQEGFGRQLRSLLRWRI